jgi:hypothetical protein
MPSNAVTTVSLVVNFDTAAKGGGSLSAEFDARADGYNKGITQFVPGDAPAFLVFASSDVTVALPVASAGNCVALAGGTMEISDDLTFADTAEASFSKPYYGSLTYKWLGRSLGIPVPSEGRIVVPTKGIGVLRVTYQSLFKAYRLTNVPNPLNGEKNYTVVIVITGTQGV